MGTPGTVMGHAREKVETTAKPDPARAGNGPGMAALRNTRLAHLAMCATYSTIGGVLAQHDNNGLGLSRRAAAL